MELARLSRRRWAFLAAGLLLYAFVYCAGRAAGAFRFVSRASHPGGEERFEPPLVEGGAWRLLVAEDPAHLGLTGSRGTEVWIGRAFGLAGWIERTLCPGFALAGMEERAFDPERYATLRVRVARAAGPGELLVERRDLPFEELALRAGEWSPIFDVPPDESLRLVWSGPGAAALSRSIEVPAGRHLDVEL